MFPDMLRSIIDKHFLTQAKFAELYSIPTRTVESWISGSRIPAPYIQEALLYMWSEQTLDRMERQPEKYKAQIDRIRSMKYRI